MFLHNSLEIRIHYAFKTGSAIVFVFVFKIKLFIVESQL